MSNTTNKQMNKMWLKVSVLVICIACVVFARKTFAESFSVGISPSIVTIKALQGQTAEVDLLIENFSKNPTTLSVSYKEFTSSEDDDNQIEFVPNSAEFMGLIPNISLILDGKKIERFEMGAEKKQKLALIIEIPEDLNDHDFTFTAIFTDTSLSINEVTNESTFSQISGSIGANILLSVGQSDHETLVIKEFSAPKILKGNPVPFSVQIFNPGKHLINPSGEIKIYNTFGQLVGKIELPRMNILAGKSRTYFDTESPGTNLKNKSKDINIYQSILWNKSFLIGPYSATLDLYLPNDIKFTRVIYFFALPYQAIFIFLIITAVIFVVKKRINHYMSS